MTVCVPAAVGVPEMMPLAALMTVPAGKPVAAYVSGVAWSSVATTFSVAFCPTMLLCAPGGLMVGAALGTTVPVDSATVFRAALPPACVRKSPVAMAVPHDTPSALTYTLNSAMVPLVPPGRGR